MKGQAKVHTMRIYTSGTLDENGKKVPDFSFKYALSLVWEQCASNAEYRTAAISAQQMVRKDAEQQNDDGSRKLMDSQLQTAANKIGFVDVDPNTPFQRGKTDMEKAADLFAKLTVEESAAVIKADKDRRKAEVAA